MRLLYITNDVTDWPVGLTLQTALQFLRSGGACVIIHKNESALQLALQYLSASEPDVTDGSAIPVGQRV